MIFLSYRRDDVPFAVGLLAARLFEAFAPGEVFLDTMANRRGLFVRRRLRQALARSTAVVSVMGPAWDDERHRSRLAGDDDLVRWELETALEQHLPMVPVLVDRDRELSGELPGRLMALHEAGEWLHYAATGHLPGKPSGSALVVVTDQAVRIAQLGGNLRVRERWQSPLGEVLGADLVERRRLRMLDVADVTFRVSGRPLPRVEGVFGDQAVRLTQLVTL